MSLFSNTILLLEHALNYSSTKQKVIAQNIANVDTPNYKAKDVASFQKVLNNEIHSLKANVTSEKHIPFTSKISERTGLIQAEKNVRYNENGNSVDVDQEMAELAENQIYYYAMTDRINGKFQTLRNVIKGGQ